MCFAPQVTQYNDLAIQSANQFDATDFTEDTRRQLSKVNTRLPTFNIVFASTTTTTTTPGPLIFKNACNRCQTTDIIIELTNLIMRFCLPNK